MSELGHRFNGGPGEGFIHIPASVPRTHLLPITRNLDRAEDMSFVVDGVHHHYSRGLLSFTSPHGAHVEVALVVDYIIVKVNDVVVAEEVRHADDADHERLREIAEHAFGVLNTIAAVVEQQWEEREREAEEARRRALDSL